MRFCTRTRLFGVLVALAFTTAVLYQVEPLRAQDEPAAASEPLGEGQARRADVAEKNRPDRLLQFLQLVEQEQTSFDFFETPLDEVASEISERLNVNVILDNQALEDLAIDHSEPMTIEISNVSLETALDMLLNSCDLDYGYRDNVVIISTVDALETHLKTRVYDVRDMLSAKQPWRSLDILMEAITGSIDPNSWEELGGNGTIHVYQGSLIVSQTWRQHRAIIHLLKELRKNIQAMGGPKMPLPPSNTANNQEGSGRGGFGGFSGGGGGFGGGSPGGGSPGGGSPGGGSPGGGGFFQVEDVIGSQASNKTDDPFGEDNAEIDPFDDDTRASDTKCHVHIEHQKPKEIDLHRRITLDLKGISLAKAMDAIAAQCDFGWIEDKRALEDLAMDTTVPVTFHAENVTLETALRLLLGEMDMSYLLTAGSVRLTSLESAESELLTRYYNARPLLNPRDPDASLNKLVELLIATVQPETWDQLGGPGTIGQYEGVLVVSNTRFTHEKIAAFLRDLSDALTAAGGVELAKPPAFDRNESDPERGRGRR